MNRGAAAIAALDKLLRQPVGSGGGHGGPRGSGEHTHGSRAADAAALREQEKEALDDFLLLHARRYDFSHADSAAAFGSTFSLLLSERFLSENWERMAPRDFQLRVLQCMRVLMRDGAHRHAFAATPGAVARLISLCVELSAEHFASAPEFSSEMLVETLSILKRFAALPELRPAATAAGAASAAGAWAAGAGSGGEHDISPAQLPFGSVGVCGGRTSSEVSAPTGEAGSPGADGSSAGAGAVGEGAAASAQLTARLHAALVSLLSTREALVLQCSLVALYQFVQVPHHRCAIDKLGPAELLLRVLSDYEASFKVLAAQLLEALLVAPAFCREVVLHDGPSVLLSLLHSDEPLLPAPLLRSLRHLAAEPSSAKEVRQLGGVNVLLSVLASADAPVAVVVDACDVLTMLATDQDAALQIRKANGVFHLGSQLLEASAPATPYAPAPPSLAEQLSASALSSAPATSAGYVADELVGSHLFRALRFLYSSERNRKIFRRLFPPDLFAAFIDVGQYVHELGAYAALAAQLASLPAEARGRIGDALADINIDRGARGERDKYVRDYAVQELLGKGGFGSVYQVRGSGEKLYAMKELPMESVGEAFEPRADGEVGTPAKLLEREVGILSSLQHPNIIRYYDSFVENRHLYIIMELVDGTTLLDHLTHVAEKSQLMVESRIWHIFCQARGHPRPHPRQRPRSRPRPHATVSSAGCTMPTPPLPTPPPRRCAWRCATATR